MKKNIFYPLIAALALALFVVSCKKAEQEVVPPVTVTAMAKTTAAPTVTSVASSLYGASNVNQYTYGNYPGYLAADLNGSTTWTVSGSNLGTSQGSSTVSLEKQVGTTWTAATSYPLTVTNWNGQIKITAASSTTSDPIQYARLKIVTSGGTAYSPTFAVVPYIYGRQYIQCNWWAIKRTIEVLGASYAWSSTYSSTRSISADYVPTANDVLMWQGQGTNGYIQHQAFIESVTVTPQSNNDTTYQIYLSESNFGTATFPHSASITVRIKKVNGVKTYATGYSSASYRPIGGVAASLVRVQ